VEVSRRVASEQRTPAIEMKRYARRLKANLSISLTCKMKSKRKREKLRKGGKNFQIERIHSGLYFERPTN
jgi:hypothetical protein